MQAPAVRMLNIKDNTFVLLNSMAFEGDACDMCQEAEVRLKLISNSLKCAQVGETVNSLLCCMPHLTVLVLILNSEPYSRNLFHHLSFRRVNSNLQVLFRIHAEPDIYITSLRL
jgi:hypothetical protein